MTTDQHLTAKELTRQALEDLPDDADIGEVIERILVLHVLQKRLERADSEPVYTQEEIEREMAECYE